MGEVRGRSRGKDIVPGDYEDPASGTRLVFSRDRRKRTLLLAASVGGIIVAVGWLLGKLLPAAVGEPMDLLSGATSLVSALMPRRSFSRKVFGILGVVPLLLLLLRATQKDPLLLKAVPRTGKKKLWECQVWEPCTKVVSSRKETAPVPFRNGSVLLATSPMSWLVCDLQVGPRRPLSPISYVPAHPDIACFGEAMAFFMEHSKDCCHLLNLRTGRCTKVPREKHFLDREGSFVLFETANNERYGYEVLDLDTGKMREVSLHASFAASCAQMSVGMTLGEWHRMWDRDDSALRCMGAASASFRYLYGGMERVFPSDMKGFRAEQGGGAVLREASSLVALLERAALHDQAAWIAEEARLFKDAATIREALGQRYHAAFLYAEEGRAREAEGRLEEAGEAYRAASRCLRLEGEAGLSEVFEGKAGPLPESKRRAEPIPAFWKCPVCGETVARADLAHLSRCLCGAPFPLPCPKGHFPMETELKEGKYCPVCGEDLTSFMNFRKRGW